MKAKVFVIILAAAAAFTACSGNQPKPVTDEKESDTNQVRPASKPAGSGYGSQPGSPGSFQQSPAPAGSGVEKPAGLVALEKAYNANPQNEETKKKLAQATYEFGHKVMLDDSLPPRVKYPEARRMFKRVLELDPNHQQAAAEKKQIEDIYASMGRPIPD